MNSEAKNNKFHGDTRKSELYVKQTFGHRTFFPYYSPSQILYLPQFGDLTNRQANGKIELQSRCPLVMRNFK